MVAVVVVIAVVEGGVGVTIKVGGDVMRVATGTAATGAANIDAPVNGDKTVNWFTYLNKGSEGNSWGNNDGSARGNNGDNVGGNNGGNPGNLLDAT